MSRNVFFAAAIVALTSSLTLLAQSKVKPDPVGPPQIVSQDASGKANRDTQEGQAKSNREQKGQAENRTQWKNADHALASCVAIGNQAEIVLAELGSQKAQNKDVKEFAQMVQNDHQEFLTKLRPFAPEASVTGYLSSDTREARSGTKSGRVQQAAAKDDVDESSKIQQTAGTKAGETKAGEKMTRGYRQLQIEREVAQQCLALAKEKLNEEKAGEFDRCFIGQQIAIHAGMKARLIVYQRHASEQLASVLADGLKTTEQHLSKAESLMKSLDQDSRITSSTSNK